MKFVKKFLIVWLFALLWVGFCNAWYLWKWTSFSLTTSYQQLDMWELGCVSNTQSSTQNQTFTASLDGSTVLFNLEKQNFYCFTWIIYIKSTWTSSNFKVFTWITNNTLTQSECDSQYNWYILPSQCNCPTCPTIDSNYCTSNNLCPSCPSCPSQYTSLECQTEYSLIPVSDVTENYCTANFDLISPADCPISSWTWDTQWSALFLNNVQYAGASNIYVNISDLLDYSTTYIDSGSSFVLDVDWYVADTWYLNDILTVQEYHPNSEDFTTAFVSVMTLWLPYIVVALFVLFIRKLVKKIFKS